MPRHVPTRREHAAGIAHSGFLLAGDLGVPNDTP